MPPVQKGIFISKTKYDPLHLSPIAKSNFVDLFDESQAKVIQLIAWNAELP